MRTIQPSTTRGVGGATGGDAREGDAATLAVDVRHLIGLHDQVDGEALAALHTGGTPCIHEQAVTATALQLRHLRACAPATARNTSSHLSCHTAERRTDRRSVMVVAERTPVVGRAVPAGGTEVTL